MHPSYDPVEHLPPPVNVEPTLRLKGSGKAYLSMALCRKLGILPDQPIDVRPPAHNGRYWYLDLRPEASHKVDWYDETRPRVRGIKLPQGLLAPTELLTLSLVPGPPPFPGYYLLRADAHLTSTPSPPLAAEARQTEV